jgi:flagellum-specific peptidoglycan hydrolase FlgJ
MKQTGVPASVTLAQAILESSDKYGNCGQSKCALPPCNNFFGIKASGNEDYVEFPTKEFKDGHAYMEPGAHFKKFASPEESFMRHGELLASLPRYRPAMEARREPLAFAMQLQQCGYSTLEDSDGNRIYAQRLRSLMTEYRLARWDIPPEPPAVVKEAA